MVKFVKSLLFVVAAIIMGLCICMFPQISGPVSVSFVSVVGLYLGVDMADTIIKSRSMAKGMYKPIHKHKYIVSAVCLLGLFITCLVMREKADVTTASAAMLSCSMMIIGILLGGLDGNKIAANHDGEPDDE